MINNLIHYVDDMGWGKAVYDSAFPMILIALLLFFLIYRKHYEISIIQAVVTYVLILSGMMMLTTVTSLIANGFEDASGGNVLRSYVYVPLICLLLAKIIKLPPGRTLDYVTPGVILWHVVGQVVCPFLGCCAGISCSWGIWNPFLDEMVFPIQWLICLAALGVMLYVLRYEKQHGYDGSGNAYPIFLVTYGVIRFFLEFLKHDGQLFLRITELGLQALFMALVGTVWLFTKEEIRRENERKAGKKRQKRRIYSSRSAGKGTPKEEKK